jgi:hypothetical protein
VTHGLRIGLRSTDAEVLERVLRRHLPPGSRPAPSPVADHIISIVVGRNDPGARIRRLHLLYANAVRLLRTADLEALLAELEGHLRTYVAEAAPRRVFVRAGVVGWNGRAIVIPGGAGSGKSRLVDALVRAGAECYSDDFAVLDPRGRVLPFPRDARASGVAEPLPLGLIVAAKYRPGARWRPRPLSPGQAALELFSHSVLGGLKAKHTLATLRRALRRAKAVKGLRGEAEETTASLLRMGVAS